MNNVLLTPPSTPPPQSGYRCPPTPESRIGIFLEGSLQLKGILGTGAYGVVYSAVEHSTGYWYAVKALSKTNANGEPLDRRQREFQSREIQLHYAASAHPNIVSMLKIIDDRDCTYVILEYCPEGDLFSNITEKGRYVSNDALVRKAFLQILNAVEHCHRLGIYHRDLKPENILVSNDGSDVLLADFGLATTEADSDDHGCGSTFYMSPECLDHSTKPSYRCAPNDIWSLGVILVNLVCGRNPWKAASLEDSTYKAFTRNPRFLLDILPLSEELNSILCRIFERNPEDRITIGELKMAIKSCQYFSPPPATAGLQTPPLSPRVSARQSASPISTNDSTNSTGSDFSDEALSDCSSLSAPASPASECDFSDYGSMSGDEINTTKNIERPQVLPTKQQYVIPSQESQPRAPVQKPMTSYVASHNPWLCQAWVSNGWPYGQAQPAQVYHPAPYAHHPYSPFQHAGDGYYY